MGEGVFDRGSQILHLRRYFRLSAFWLLGSTTYNPKSKIGPSKTRSTHDIAIAEKYETLQPSADRN
jgi:hypothetical protein